MTESDITEQNWKYSDGANIGDWIEFKNSRYRLSNDTIYLDTKPVAKIISSRISTFGSSRTILIETTFDRQKGSYVEK